MGREPLLHTINHLPSLNAVSSSYGMAIHSYIGVVRLQLTSVTHQISRNPKWEFCQINCCISTLHYLHHKCLNLESSENNNTWKISIPINTDGIQGTKKILDTIVCFHFSSENHHTSLQNEQQHKMILKCNVISSIYILTEWKWSFHLFTFFIFVLLFIGWINFQANYSIGFLITTADSTTDAHNLLQLISSHLVSHIPVHQQYQLTSNAYIAFYSLIPQKKYWDWKDNQSHSATSTIMHKSLKFGGFLFLTDNKGAIFWNQLDCTSPPYTKLLTHRNKELAGSTDIGKAKMKSEKGFGGILREKKFQSKSIH